MSGTSHGPHRAPPHAVLFACTRNMVRSPMAAAILQFHRGRRIYVDSVGVQAGTEIDPFAVAVLEETGIDVRHHHPKAFDDLFDGSFDLIVALSPEARDHAARVTRTWAVDLEYWETPDPTQVGGSRLHRLNAYRAVRDRLFDGILTRFPVPHASMDP